MEIITFLIYAALCAAGLIAANAVYGIWPIVLALLSALAAGVCSRCLDRRAVVAGLAIVLLISAVEAGKPSAAVSDEGVLITLCSALALLIVGTRRNRSDFRILMVTRHIAPDVGGTETFVSDFLKYTSGRGIQVDVVTLEPVGGRISPPPHTAIHYVSWKPLVKALWKYRETKSGLIGMALFGAAVLALSARAIMLIPRLRPSTVYAVGGPIAAAVGVLCKTFAGTPLVLHFHRMYQWSKKARPVREIVSAVYRYSNFVVGNSTMIEDDAKSLDSALKNVVGISNWVDSSVFYPRADAVELRAKWDVPLEATVLLFTGLFDPIKQADKIAAALAQLNEPRVLFLFAGHGPLESEIVALNRPGCAVRMLGMCNHSELAELANLADVHFWGSVDVKYPGLVVMEAMMCGAPEVTTSVTMNDRWDGHAVVDATSFGAPNYAWTFEPTEGGICDAVRFVADNVMELRRIRPGVAEYANDAFGLKNAERLLSYLRAAGGDN